MRRLFVVSDLHFMHDNVIKFCNRDVTPEEHDEMIIREFNSVVSEDDIVINLGDIAYGMHNYRYPKETLKNLYSRLNGSHILVRGNHDEETDEFYRRELGFLSVHEYLQIGTNFFCHYPATEDKWTTKKQREMNEIFNKSGCTRLYHGHIHNKVVDDEFLRNTFTHINCCVDANNFKPVFIKEL